MKTLTIFVTVKPPMVTPEKAKAKAGIFSSFFNFIAE
jgi:hypothetical protein